MPRARLQSTTLGRARSIRRIQLLLLSLVLISLGVRPNGLWLLAMPVTDWRRPPGRVSTSIGFPSRRLGLRLARRSSSRGAGLSRDFRSSGARLGNYGGDAGGS
eukprot:9477780-Pyramimonas_sp.AAC.1